MEKIRNYSFVLLLCSLPLLICCGKTDAENRTKEKAREIYDRFNVVSKNGGSESFLYFTDPHLLSYGNNFNENIKNQLVSSFDLAKEVISPRISSIKSIFQRQVLFTIHLLRVIPNSLY